MGQGRVPGWPGGGVKAVCVGGGDGAGAQRCFWGVTPPGPTTTPPLPCPSPAIPPDRHPPAELRLRRLPPGDLQLALQLSGLRGLGAGLLRQLALSGLQLSLLLLRLLAAGWVGWGCWPTTPPPWGRGDWPSEQACGGGPGGVGWGGVGWGGVGWWVGSGGWWSFRCATRQVVAESLASDCSSDPCSSIEEQGC